MLALVLSNCSSNSHPENNARAAPVSPGETATVGDFSLTLSNLRDPSTIPDANGFGPPQPGDHYAAFDATIANTTTKPRRLSLLNLEVVDADRKSLTYNTTPGSAVVPRDWAGHETQKITIYVEIPALREATAVLFDPDAVGNPTIFELRIAP